MATKRYTLALLTGLCTLAVPLSGHAEEAKKMVVGASTENILAMQREGNSAGAPQPVAGEVATRSYHRYLDSFSKPMPEFKETVKSSTKSD
ncbi:MAG: DUF3613 domain-containing protein [Thiobacillus sp.]|nr:DUF3613 domain-containing protein [Thiobacillus sp.]